MHRSAARDWEEPELLSDPPHNIELEQALLGVLVISNESYHRVSPLVRLPISTSPCMDGFSRRSAISLPRIRPLGP